jgi:hypothetical protein
MKIIERRFYMLKKILEWKHTPTVLAAFAALIGFGGNMISSNRNNKEQIEAAREQAAIVAKEESRRHFERLECKDDDEET